MLAMDVVGYSRLLIDEQSRVIAALTRLVRETSRFRAAEADGKLIRLPAGDGMYLVFFDAFASPVECAIELGTALKSHPDIRLRIGIHSGPVRQVVDVNDRANVAGAGIDVAQRVMDCGDAGHILLSKRVADDLAPDPRWHAHLHDLGAFDVKHGVQIHLVNFYSAEFGNPAAPRRGRQRDPRADAGTPGARVTDAIAVLPLENMSGQPAEEYFADGMTEALITDLAKIGGLKVISRGSVMAYKGARRPLAEIGEKLGVDAIVEGSVLHAGGRVRISARLVRVGTDECLWAERYDRDLADVLALQDEVARAIAQAIDRTLHRRSPAAPRRVDPQAYLLDLQGRHLLHQRTESGFRAALRLFEDAVGRDPDYAPAYIGIAESMNMLSNYGLVPPQQIRPRSLAAARRALELDEHSAEAHRLLAFAHWQFAFEWEAAIAEYERALELAPNSPATTYWFGAFLAVMGDFDRAHQLLNRAHELDPLSLIIPSVQGWAYVFARRFADALPFMERVLAIDPAYHVALWFQGEALIELERYDEGIDSLTRAYELGGRTSRLLGYLGYACGRAGQAIRAQECLAELEARELHQYVPPYFPALVLCGLGEHDRALDRLERAHASGDTMLRDLKADAQWDRMRSLPRFEALMQAMAFPDLARSGAAT